MIFFLPRHKLREDGSPAVTNSKFKTSGYCVVFKRYMGQCIQQILICQASEGEILMLQSGLVNCGEGRISVVLVSICESLCMPTGAPEGPDSVCSLAGFVYFVLLLRMRKEVTLQDASGERFGKENGGVFQKHFFLLGSDGGAYEGTVCFELWFNLYLLRFQTLGFRVFSLHITYGSQKVLFGWLILWLLLL